jgi:hypothetical protein
MSTEAFKKKLLKKASKSVQPVEEKLDLDNLTVEDYQRFLNYKCNYKKHKGKTWEWVFTNDLNYFKWVMGVMNPQTQTWRVLSSLYMTPEEQKERLLTFQPTSS